MSEILFDCRVLPIGEGRILTFSRLGVGGLCWIGSIPDLRRDAGIQYIDQCDSSFTSKRVCLSIQYSFQFL